MDGGMSRSTALMGFGAAVLGVACSSSPLPARSADANTSTRPRVEKAESAAARSEGDDPPLFGADTMNPADPQADADVALLDGPCKPFLALMQVASLVEDGRQPDSWEIVQRSGVVSLSPDLLGLCTEAMSRGLRRFRSAAVESEAHVVVHQIARLMSDAYRRNQRYCPPTATPVPSRQDEIGEHGYQPVPADFQSPTWTCLGLDLVGEHLHFQYEVNLPEGTRGKSFEIVAKGRPLQDGPMVELRRVGTLSKDGSHLLISAAKRTQY